MLLGTVVTENATGAGVKLHHRDVIGQLPSVFVGQVIQVRVAGPDTIAQRRQKTLLQFTFALGWV